MQFILGGSGSGKSTFLTDLVIAESIAHPETQYLVLVPEQFTLQTQQEYIRRHPRHGILNIDVLSFERLAYRVLAEVGADTATILRDTGKSLMLRRAVSRIQDQLPVFGRNFRKPGYVSEMKSLMSELTQYRVGNEMLADLADECDDPSLAAKLRDIIRIRGVYEEAMGTTYTTAEELLERLADVVPQSRLLNGAVIACDGFTGFTPMQELLMGELLKAADMIYITATLDPSEQPGRKTTAEDLFHLSQDMIRILSHKASELGIELKEPVRMSGYPRYEDAPELSFLEQNLFRQGKASYEKTPERISLHRNRNPKEETERVAGSIQELVKSGKARYREIAVIAGSMEVYADLMEEAFRQRKIPCFIDRTRDLMDNACVEYVRSAVALVEESYSYESMFRFLKSGLHNIDTKDLFLLENYCLATGMRGFGKWQESWVRRPKSITEEELACVETVRGKLMEELAEFTAALRDRNRTVRSVTQALYELLVSQRIQEKLVGKEAAYTAQQQLAAAREYGQIYKVLLELFDQFVLLLGEEKITLTQYRELLDAGLTDAKIGIAPPSADQVTVGDLERTRLGQVNYLFVVGMNDAYLPGISARAGILNERDRRTLSEQGIRLSPAVQERMLLQRFYLYLALTRPGQHLSLSYCNVDSKGKAMRPTYYLKELEGRFPKLVTADEVDRIRFADLAGNRGTAYAYLAGRLEKTGGKAIQEDPVWQELYSWYAREDDGRARLEKLVDGFFVHDPGDSLTSEKAAELFHHLRKESISKLEQYAKCPYSYFLKYGLELREREEYVWNYPDEGTILHEALYQYAMLLNQNGLTWRTVSDEERDRLCDEALERAITLNEKTVLTDTARLSYQIQRMNRTLNKTAWALGEQIKPGEFDPAGYEIYVGQDQEGALAIPLDEHHAMNLRGRIDRVDLVCSDGTAYVKVLDYKTGNKKLDLGAIYQGLDLQLAVYLSMASAYAKSVYPDAKPEPAAVLYYHVTDPMLSRKELADAERETLRKLRPEGVFNEEPEIARLLDTGIPDEYMESLVAPIKVKKSGGYWAHIKTLTTEEFTLLDGHIREVIAQEGRDILDGKIPVRPMRYGKESGCEYCDYKGICGFNKMIPGYTERMLRKMDKDEVRLKLHANAPSADEAHETEQKTEE